METRQEEETAVVLPGYETRPDESGVDHSTRKLAEAAGELERLLGSIDGGDDEEEELSFPSILDTIPCQTEKDSWAYRCRCAFQLISENDEEGGRKFHYAMRQQQQPIRLGSFPIASRRIQQAMKDLLDQVLNVPSIVPPAMSTMGAAPQQQQTPPCSFHEMKRHLTSVTFAAAWHDVPESDCIITLHYDQPLDKEKWEQEAVVAYRILRLRQLNGRSKKCLLSAISEDGKESQQTLRDTLWMRHSRLSDDSKESHWKVTLRSPSTSHITQGDDDDQFVIPVHYEKPNTAFYHPNAGAMVKALEWMLGRLSWIVQEKSKAMKSKGYSSHASPSLSMLEMYCGCGAHTVALAKSGLLDEIVAVELDQRLVEACYVNVRLNKLNSEDEEESIDSRPRKTTRVHVVRQDAGKWAKQAAKKAKTMTTTTQHDQNTTNKRQQLPQNHLYHDILLVDPPRMGLDETVCQMAAMAGQFEHFLYISCGRKALLRDLERLSPDFQVINCTQLDLFPRTDAIETLVHLRRRRSKNDKQEKDSSIT